MSNVQTIADALAEHCDGSCCDNEPERLRIAKVALAAMQDSVHCPLCHDSMPLIRTRGARDYYACAPCGVVTSQWGDQ